jgi:Asp-tRNA(Asn)/Glu-tRNA(Gln) amidotransferase A subunit family amidase
MPHAILRGGTSIADLWENFEPHKELSGSDVLQLEAAFLRKDRSQMLVLALAIENGVTQRFFIVVGMKGQKIAIRCQHHQAFEKTSGVQALVAQVVKTLVAAGAVVQKTNLPGLDADH